MTNKEKKEAIASHFSSIMKILDLDLNDDSLKDTPNRVAKMYVEDLFEGLDKDKIPHIKKFENSFKLDKNFIVAVSGGADSLALAFLTKLFALKNKLNPKYYIVDHKLRKESTSEALKVKKILNS